MRNVVILGVGQTQISEQWEKSLREIAGEAVFAALLDAGLDSVEGIFVGNMLSGLLSRQEAIGAMIADVVARTSSVSGAVIVGWTISRSLSS